MDPEKASLLFGEVPSWADPDDQDDRAALVAQRLGIPDDASSGEIRETLERLFAQFEQTNRRMPPELIAMRPDHLRDLLGLRR